MTKTFYITTPIYYPNDNLHIGHAYTTIAADVIARYKRMRGYEVFYLTGTDEHGQKIEKKALSLGKEPKEFVDSIVTNIKNLWEKLDISYDYFIRTTDKQHIETVWKVFEKLQAKGDIYLGKYEGYYCVDCESFFLEREVANSLCPDCKREIKKIVEESYFFRMSKYVDRLLLFYKENEEFIQPFFRKKEILKNFIEPGLEDLSISRTTFNWGIPILTDPKHVIYVWLDALINYISALGYLSADERLFKKFWPCDVHLIGKEILRFHVIYWPIILMALDLPLPKKVFAHGFFTVKGQKMSKSKGNVVNPLPLVERYGADFLRYFLLKEIPFGEDGVFTPENFLTRFNTDFVNDLSNLFHRTLNMVEKYNDFKVIFVQEVDEEEQKLQQKTLKVIEDVESSIDEFKFSKALKAIFELIRYANKYIEKTKPWELSKSLEKRDKLNKVLFNLVETLRIVAILLSPFLTKVTKELFVQLNVPLRYTSWINLEPYTFKKDWLFVKKSTPLFKRLNIEEELTYFN